MSVRTLTTFLPFSVNKEKLPRVILGEHVLLSKDNKIIRTLNPNKEKEKKKFLSFMLLSNIILRIKN